MEDLNMLAADCVVISCCCQCLILQILILVFLKLPYKLVLKTKNYTTKKLLLHRGRGRKKQEKKIMEETNREMEGLKNEFVVGFLGESMRRRRRNINEEEGHDSCGCCMEDVEKVLEELSLKGEFAFGSFWGRGDEHHQFDYDSSVHYHLIDQIFGSFSSS